MFFIPYEKFGNVTSLEKTEIFERIKRSDNFRECIFQDDDRKNANGLKKHERLKTRPKYKRRNSFVPVIFCEIIQGLDSKTYINYIIRPFIYVMVFATACLIPLFVLSVKSITEYENNAGALNIDFAPIAVFFIVLTSFISVFKFKIPKIKRQMLEMLDAEILE